ncbi:MAG TPA: PPOX class F420-dependent oxidoreductase [Gaiellaceae bacterium]|jgi:PPOX class probable F420-dependent enzyme|nr:PPOX class F420-dependent oxidoreductase [Gaiellaceae bacterium]
MVRLTDEQGQFLKTKNLATIATIRPDGSAQLTPVWIDWDGENVVFNTAEGRFKPRYIRQNRMVSVEVLDREDPYRWISITGPAEISEDGAEEHINELSHRYNDGRDYNYVPGEKRLIVRIKPERVTARGL